MDIDGSASHGSAQVIRHIRADLDQSHPAVVDESAFEWIDVSCSDQDRIAAGEPCSEARVPEPEWTGESGWTNRRKGGVGVTSG
jgi:hypothetical protein